MSSKTEINFARIGEYYNFEILCHVQTKVVYAVSNAGVFTPMLDSDGSVLKYKGSIHNLPVLQPR